MGKTIKKLKYETEPHRNNRGWESCQCITLCLEMKWKIGTHFCSICKYHEKEDYNLQIVYCSSPLNNAKNILDILKLT